MVPTYISAALFCAASLLVGRSLLAALGERRWSWLEPAVGLAALLTVAGFFARVPGHATTAAVFVIARWSRRASGFGCRMAPTTPLRAAGPWAPSGRARLSV